MGTVLINLCILIYARFYWLGRFDIRLGFLNFAANGEKYLAFSSNFQRFDEWFFRAQLQNVISKMENLNKKSQTTEKDLKTISLALGAAQTQLKVLLVNCRFYAFV